MVIMRGSLVKFLLNKRLVGNLSENLWIVVGISINNGQGAWLIKLAVQRHDFILTGDLGKIKWRGVGFSLNNLEVSWLILFVREWDIFGITLSLDEVHWIVLNIPLVNSEVSCFVLVIVDWHNLGELDILLWRLNVVRFKLKDVIVDSIDNDISHAEIFVTTHSRVVGMTWLVYGPVVIWWIVDWVSSIKLKVGLLLWLLLNERLEVIDADSDFFETSSELMVGHGIGSQIWVDEDWDTLVLKLDEVFDNWG